ncbi:MAG: hypothetical protein JSV23_01730 [Promethearchaeota archaeon]|nr:MAG: hypothetical protein JSV23_01730 [Candidatus Lokiarchaeota archaeon]
MFIKKRGVRTKDRKYVWCQGRDYSGIRSRRIPLNFIENERRAHFTRYLDLQFHLDQ